MSEKNLKDENGAVVDAEELLEGKPDMISIKEAADILGIHPRSIRRIIAKGEARAETREETVTVVRKIDQVVRKVYVSLDDLIERREKYKSSYPQLGS